MIRLFTNLTSVNRYGLMWIGLELEIDLGFNFFIFFLQ